MVFKITFILLFCCFCFACKRSKNKDDSIVRITIPELRNDVWMDMSEIIDTVVYIPLVTSDSCLLDMLYIPFGATMAYDKGYFVALADSYRLMQQAPGIAAKLRLKEDDNPVIVLYRLKQN